ncbi:DDE-type integrase/transposase/recombinase [Teredinibacter turnerae]|uniref:DDE-type integrase/transposase/recombinase n=1 Tax=Teredinibacter turnerae TaxID=2426 RepID=UPI000373E4FC|nr:DDE-type integrase/transposase/recombinase [Teredinibacter turnerae]
MFQANEVLEVEGKKYRILDAYATEFIWFELSNPKALPALVHLEVLEQLVRDERLARVDDPYSNLLLETPEKGSKAYQKRQKSMGIIASIVADAGCYEPKERAKRIELVVEKENSHKTSIYRLLRRYWERGQIPNAFLPDYKNSGGKGKKRVNAASKGIGRPRIYSEGSTATVSSEVESLFRTCIEKHLLTEKTRTITAAHGKFQNLYLQYFPEVSEQNIPTRRQFEYFYKREYNDVARIMAQSRFSDYQKDIRPILGTATENALGPGSRYEIDATIADIYLVADHDRTKIIGRPTVYMVIDVFSRLIAGFYVGMDAPSYVTAMQAVIHAFSDKVEYCKKLGTEIRSEDWPSIGLPDCLLADRGELMSHQADNLVSLFNVNLEIAPPYRGDAKGIVERNFRTIQAVFKPYAPGVVQGNKIKKHGDRDYRLDAKLSLTDFREIILNQVLLHNQAHVMKKYDRADDMPNDLPPIPIELWRWGLQSRAGRLRTVDSDRLKINLLPRMKVSISEHGVKMFGIYYTCQEILKRGWLHRNSSIDRPQNLHAAYDPGSADNIFLFPENGKSAYWVCDLTTKSREYAGITFWEVWEKQAESKRLIVNKELEAKKRKRELEQLVEDKIKAAEKLYETPSDSNAQRIKDINKNKKEIKKLESAENAYRPNKPKRDVPAQIVPIDKGADSSDYPDFMSELFDEDDE